MKKRPNIILFNPDQMRADALHHLGNSASVTPTLDEMASTDAVSFRNVFCQNPVCVPSRCSFMTGLYPHTTGHRTMGYLLRENETSLLKELKDAGYYVWANARNDLIAGQIPGLLEEHVTELYYGGNTPAAPGPVKENGRGGPGNKDFYSFFTGEMSVDDTGRNYDGDDEDVDAAIDRIKHPVDDRPMCIFLGLMYPHPPYKVEEPYFSAIDRSVLPDRIRPEDTEGKAKILELIRNYQGMQEYTEIDWDELRAVYLGMCMKVDDQFKRLCDALKEAGQYDNSAIFFFSDHGDYTGDYGLTEKTQNSFEDCLTNVPFLVKPPADFSCDPGVTNSMAELVDLYATVLDFAETSPTHSHFGRPLQAVLADRKQSIRGTVFCEGGRLANERHCSEAVNPEIQGRERNLVYWPRYAAQWDDEAHAKGTMIRTREWKYVYRAEGKCELYDLIKDPQEKRNRADDPSCVQIIAGLSAELLAWYQNTCDVVPYEPDERFSKRMIWEKVKNLCPKGYEEEVKNRIDSGMGLFPAQYYCRDLAAGQKS